MIIGITGTIGAGKGTVVDYLKKHHNFSHYSARDFIAEEVYKRGLPVDRDNLVMVGNDLRAKNHPGYVAESLYKKAKKGKKNSVLESLRTLGEVSLLRDKGDFLLLAVDADPKKRFERIKKRGLRTDHISYQKFLEEEEREMTSNDPHKQNLRACIDVADFVAENNDSFEELYKKLENLLLKINAERATR